MNGVEAIVFQPSSQPCASQVICRGCVGTPMMTQVLISSKNSRTTKSRFDYKYSRYNEQLKRFLTKTTQQD